MAGPYWILCSYSEDAGIEDGVNYELTLLNHDDG